MATSLFAPSLPQPPPPHFHNVGVYAHNEAVATRTTTQGQYAVQLQQEVFNSYLRLQGISRGAVIFKGPVGRSGGLDWELGKHLDVSVTAESSPPSSDFSSPSTPTVAFSPHHEREESASLRVPGNLPTYECLVCTEAVSPLTSFKAPCGHHYCPSCLEGFVNASLKDDNIFPPQCCRKPLPLGLLSPNDTSLSWPSPSSSNVCLNLNANIKLIHSLSEKTRERSVPIKDRIYCPVPQCSVFLGSLTILRAYHDDSSLCTCHSCGMIICLRCTQPYHRGKTCTHFSSSASASASAALAAENQLKSLAKEKKWQTCPGCSALVERSMGCPHMACRCGTQFCYGCGVDWREGCRCSLEELGVPLPALYRWVDGETEKG
ncbi:hypothetical protein D9758_014944 [Tetrapyrgos nigripes]|uniref:RBR-type E3 ubiquitin transferase n=1 Tax=Tetrapyrgos nigripes TaxID=182062 RepID=A0A8H5CLN5_9AGAR|nr:hypothetical protein D9758_014944 [Tetrapyrgos nigripes]